MKHTDRLKRPIAVYILATVFLLAPLLVLGITLRIYEFPGSTHPSTWGKWLLKIPTTQWVPFILFWASGLLLLLQRRWSWLAALVTLISNAIWTLGVWIFFDEILESNPSISLAICFVLIFILFHFRFPYLDRRESFFSTARRYLANIPAKLDNKNYIVVNISLSGALVESTQHTQNLDEVSNLTIGNLSVVAKAVRKAHTHSVGLRFQNLSNEDKKKLSLILNELKARGPLAKPSLEETKHRFPFLF